jgi:D-alanine-D-alanine ligase
MKKIKVAVFLGGRSAEHEISLLSAINVIKAIDKSKYDIVPVGIDKEGNFIVYDLNKKFILNIDDPKKICLAKGGKLVTFRFGRSRELIGTENTLRGPQSDKIRMKIDVAFLVLHGSYGEDGTMQGLLKTADIPFVGASVLSSAVCMDKEVAKRLLRDAGLPVAEFLAFNLTTKREIYFEMIVKKLGLPFFIKPANAGSSVGISRIKNKKMFNRSVAQAFKFDNKILFEKEIIGKEIECSIIGNEQVNASLPGRVLPKREFYSYQAKYLDDDGAIFEIPAKLSQSVADKIRETAVKAYQVLDCEGMARVDGFLTDNNKFIINEINTIPGFTAISMYPKLWAVSGINYSQLIDRLIQLAIKRWQRDNKIKTSFK